MPNFADSHTLPWLVAGDFNQVFIDEEPACLFTPVEIEHSSKLYENALVMKFSNGRPALHEIKSHILNRWKFSYEPVIGLLDLRHVLILPANKEDMALAMARDSKIIGTSMFRISRWTRDFKFDKDSTRIAVWIRLPHLPLLYFNTACLERLSNSIGNFIRADDRTIHLQNLVFARMCVEIDVTVDRPSRVWIGETKEKGFWQKVWHFSCLFCLSVAGLSFPFSFFTNASNAFLEGL